MLAECLRFVRAGLVRLDPLCLSLHIPPTRLEFVRVLQELALGGEKGWHGLLVAKFGSLVFLEIQCKPLVRLRHEQFLVVFRHDASALATLRYDGANRSHVFSLLAISFSLLVQNTNTDVKICL